MSDELVTLTIDGREVTVPKGTLIIRAAEGIGNYIPRFCDHPLLDPLGACRQCFVEVEGQRKPLTACTTPVADGMVVKTQQTSELAREGQEGMLEFLLINHPLDCPMCDKGGECPLQDQALAYGPGDSRYIDPKRRFTKPVPISPLIKLDRERCVLCARCTRFASEISGDPFIELFERSALEQVAIFEDEPYQSELSGNVIQICPVGALTSATFRFRARPFDVATTQSTCNRCASGCAITVQERRGQIERVLARADHAANDEWICDKGRFAYAYVREPARVTEPLVRKENGFVAVSWAEALRVVADRIAEARAESRRPGVLTSGQLLDEDAYAVSRFARVVLGTNDVAVLGADPNPELWSALPRSRTAGYPDIDRAGAAVVLGTDLQQDAPIVFLRVRKNQRKRGIPVIEIGPRRSALGRSGATWLPCLPGGEAGALLALAAALGERGGSGLDPITRAAAGGAGARAAIDASGADAAAVEGIAATLADAGDVVVLGGDRLDGEAAALAWNVAVALGGRYGWVPRKAGASGAVWAGLHPALLPGGRRAEDADARAEVERVWGVEVPREPGAGARAILRGDGPLFLFGADPGPIPEGRFTVAADVLLTPTVERADVVLPAAPVYERAGTLTGWDGVARHVEAAVKAAGLAQTDAAIVAGIAQAAGVAFPSAPDELRSEMDILARAMGDARPLGVGEVRAARADGLVAFGRARLIDDGAMMAGADLLRAAAAPSAIELHPEDAAAAGVADGAQVTVTSAHGEARGPAKLTTLLARGAVALPLGVAGIDARAVLDPSAPATPVRITGGGR